MLKEERQQQILDILNSEQKVIASDLSQRLKVSEDTIRRDLKELDAQKKIKRVHSGALRVGPPITDFNYRISLDQENKNKLAKKALTFLREDSVIIFDGSTTNLALIKALPLDFHATIITNSPPIMVALADYPNIEVISLGGSFYKRSMINLGAETLLDLRNLRADLYVMGIYNIDLDSGTSVPTAQEATIKREMIKISSEVLGMATSDKFGAVSNVIVSPIDELNYLISLNLPAAVKKMYSKQDFLLID